MLHEAVDDPGQLDVTELRTTYDAILSETIESVGTESIAAKTEIDLDRIEAIRDGGATDLTLSEAAAILAVKEDAPDADTIVYEVRDHILMGMTNAVLDVDSLASYVETDLTGQELQQAIEGRTRLTLDELAAIEHAIAARGPDR